MDFSRNLADVAIIMTTCIAWNIWTVWILILFTCIHLILTFSQDLMDRCLGGYSDARNPTMESMEGRNEDNSVKMIIILEHVIMIAIYYITTSKWTLDDHRYWWGKSNKFLSFHPLKTICISFLSLLLQSRMHNDDGLPEHVKMQWEHL